MSKHTPGTSKKGESFHGTRVYVSTRALSIAGQTKKVRDNKKGTGDPTVKKPFSDFKTCLPVGDIHIPRGTIPNWFPNGKLKITKVWSPEESINSKRDLHYSKVQEIVDSTIGTYEIECFVSLFENLSILFNDCLLWAASCADGKVIKSINTNNPTSTIILKQTSVLLSHINRFVDGCWDKEESMVYEIQKKKLKDVAAKFPLEIEVSQDKLISEFIFAICTFLGDTFVGTENSDAFMRWRGSKANAESLNLVKVTTCMRDPYFMVIYSIASALEVPECRDYVNYFCSFPWSFALIQFYNFDTLYSRVIGCEPIINVDEQLRDLCKKEILSIFSRLDGKINNNGQMDKCFQNHLFDIRYCSSLITPGEKLPYSLDDNYFATKYKITSEDLERTKEEEDQIRTKIREETAAEYEMEDEVLEAFPDPSYLCSNSHTEIGFFKKKECDLRKRNLPIEPNLMTRLINSRYLRIHEESVLIVDFTLDLEVKLVMDLFWNIGKNSEKFNLLDPNTLEESSRELKNSINVTANSERRDSIYGSLMAEFTLKSSYLLKEEVMGFCELFSFLHNFSLLLKDRYSFGEFGGLIPWICGSSICELLINEIKSDVAKSINYIDFFHKLSYPFDSYDQNITDDVDFFLKEVVVKECYKMIASMVQSEPQAMIDLKKTEKESLKEKIDIIPATVKTDELGGKSQSISEITKKLDYLIGKVDLLPDLILSSGQPDKNLIITKAIVTKEEEKTRQQLNQCLEMKRQIQIAEAPSTQSIKPPETSRTLLEKDEVDHNQRKTNPRDALAESYAERMARIKANMKPKAK